MTSVNQNNIAEDFVYLHRILAHMGWTDVILTHLSARVSRDSFFISPFGLLFEEVTKEDLVLMESLVVKHGHYQSNPVGVIIHEAIMRNKIEVGCIIHTHTDAGVAVSCLEKEIFLPDQMSCVLYNQIGYHDFDGIVLDELEQNKILENLGSKKCLILKNHGLLVVGTNIADALWNYYYLEKMCRIYISLLPVSEKLVFPSTKIMQKTYLQHEKFNIFGNLVRGVAGNSDLLFQALKRKIKNIYYR